MKIKAIEIIGKPEPESDNEIELKPSNRFVQKQTIQGLKPEQTKAETPPIPTPEPEVKAPKPKRVLTDKQKETLAKGREARDLKRKERLNENTKKAEEEKKVIEQKIVKKAIQIKKKQIKREKIIALTDDEEDEEPTPPLRQRTVKAPVYRQPQTAPKNKVFFV